LGKNEKAWAGYILLYIFTMSIHFLGIRNMYRANGQSANNIPSHQQKRTKKPLVTVIYQIMK